LHLPFILLLWTILPLLSFFWTMWSILIWQLPAPLLTQSHHSPPTLIPLPGLARTCLPSHRHCYPEDGNCNVCWNTETLSHNVAYPQKVMQNLKTQSCKGCCPKSVMLPTSWVHGTMTVWCAGLSKAVEPVCTCPIYSRYLCDKFWR
jgi:hypothetical protein